MANNSNGWDADDHEDRSPHVERRTAIEARLRAEFEEQLDANIDNERRKVIEARLRAEFEEQLGPNVKERFKHARKRLMQEIEAELIATFEEELDDVINEELARLDEEAATVRADTARRVAKQALGSSLANEEAAA
jgi:L-lactate utilization protein LutC